ncbi:MAG TPA: hypothetical protein VL095_13330, partial [Flavisolibacter sp.]|nr:hypothetical protein [Flavisolibacter sp.]
MHRDQPVIIKKSVRVESFSSRDRTFSPVVAQWFYKIPSDKSITILSKVHPMYTAGGPEALIDSVQGNEN